ncbi:hypothetical protein MTR67_010840 [Solanum verrucosum]|uniref:HMG box domain-containing protein n=1 Tax=Solanum verrucosum TaxID=315347 RepID=A0AAF0TLD3_SOLVR|nr:hypothetical protein MTR67_010840 [Solanum verrucosum]
MSATIFLFHQWKGSENNEARATEVVPVLPDDDDDAVDPHLERIKNEAGGDDSDEEYLCLPFVLSEVLEMPSDIHNLFRMKILSSIRMMEGLLLTILEGMNLMPVVVVKSAKKKPKKEATVSKPSTSRKKADGDASKKKKQKKKRDPNPPKKAISAFMYFLQSKREVAEEKKPFEAMAKADKKCYSEQISDYRNLQPTAMDSGSESGCF